MIETVYNEETDGTEKIKLPKNIRQIGSGETKYHIYIEDKVSEYLKLIPENEQDVRYGVLLGNVKFSKGEMYLFIRAVIDVEEIFDNTILFGDEIWTGIYDDLKRYFHGEKIIGWYASLPDYCERDFFQFRKIQLDHFAGNDKVFLNINREENDKSFYVYSMGELQKIGCYHIYYEKNPDLESYIFEKHYNLTTKKHSEQIRGESVLNKREEKNDEQQNHFHMEETKDAAKEEKEKKDSMLYRRLALFSGKAASFFVIGALVFTVGMMYKKGQLDNLTVEMKEVVAGIMNKGDSTQMDDILLVNEDREITTEPTQNTQEETTTEPESEQVSEDQTQEQAQEQATETVETVTEEQTTQASIVPENVKYYTVEKGDTLYGICRKLYGNTNNLEVIMELNSLENPDSIAYGNTLIVP